MDWVSVRQRSMQKIFYYEGLGPCVSEESNMVDLLNPETASANLSSFPYGESKAFQGFPSLSG